MSFEPAEKEGHIGNVRSNTYHMVKIWWKSAQKILSSLCRKVYFKKRKQLMQAKHIPAKHAVQCSNDCINNCSSHSRKLCKLLITYFIGPHRMQAVYKMRPTATGVCLSVCTRMCLVKMVELIEMAWLTRFGPRNHILGGGQDLPQEGPIFGACR